MKCQRCGTEFEGNFCPNCGEAVGAESKRYREAPPVRQEPTIEPEPKRYRETKVEIKQPFYTKTWFILLTLLICCFPLGLFLMWKYKKFNKPVRIILTTVLVVFYCLNVSSLLASGSLLTPSFTKAVKFETNQSVSESESRKPSDSDGKAVSNPDVSIDRQFIFNQDGITVETTGLSENELFGPELGLLITNGSNQNITVQARNTAVNGYMIDSTLSSDVVAGKKANASLTFMRTDLEKCSVGTIADIEFSLHIFDPGSFDTLYDSEIITLKTDSAEGYSQVYDDSGEVLYDSNGIKIVFKGLVTGDSIFGPQLMIYTENNTDQTITIQARNTSVNGYMIEPTLSTEMTPANKAISGITFFESQLEENQITKFETVETSFHIFNENFDTIVDTEPIMITIK